jgi:putative DNA primase/helicase
VSRQERSGVIVRIKQAADCRVIFKRFWPNHFRERGNCICPFHDDSRSSLQVSRQMVFCHAENFKLDAVDLYARATGTTNGRAVAELAKELGLRQAAGPQAAGPKSRREAVRTAPVPGAAEGSAAPRIVAVYDYTDAEGKLLYQTVRYEPKTFRQRRPGGGATAWIWKLDGVARVPYRLPEAIKADTVFVVEGEKDADRLAQAGLAATTNSEGAGKWRPELSGFLAAKKVVILPDNDEAGKSHARDVAAKLAAAGAASVKIVELPNLPPKGDVSDWLDGGGTKECLLKIVRSTSFFINIDGSGAGAQGKRPELRKAPFALTDFGNAERFAEQHCENIRYCHTWGKWLIWSGNHWKVDETAKINQLCKATVRSIYAEASQISEDERRKAVSKHARASESAGRIQAMLSLAQSEPDIAVTGRDLDTNPWLLNVLNGTLDTRTGELSPHQRSDIITKLAPVAYDPEAECPQWFSFLDRIMAGSQGLISYLQRLAGYCLTGDTREKCLPVLHGGGNNGKTIFTATIGAMLGDYAKETPVETLMIKRNETIPNDIAGLKGARLVTAS